MNRENFTLVLDQIKNHPETWDQDVWHCGTKHCFAGWAQILAGKRSVEYNSTKEDAMEFLGVSQDEAYWLFSTFRTIDDFEKMLEHGFYDDDGYGLDGFDEYNIDRYGFDRNGFNCAGYDRDGKHRDDI